MHAPSSCPLEEAFEVRGREGLLRGPRAQMQRGRPYWGQPDPWQPWISTPYCCGWRCIHRRRTKYHYRPAGHPALRRSQPLTIQPSPALARPHPSQAATHPPQDCLEAKPARRTAWHSMGSIPEQRMQRRLRGSTQPSPRLASPGGPPPHTARHRPGRRRGRPQVPCAALHGCCCSRAPRCAGPTPQAGPRLRGNTGAARSSGGEADTGTCWGV
jgi:hypothetical protein